MTQMTDLLRRSDDVGRLFKTIAACWDQSPRCGANTRFGEQCRRPAQWQLNLHGCDARVLCAQHLRVWERKAADTMEPYCASCGGRWSHLTDAYTATAL